MIRIATIGTSQITESLLEAVEACLEASFAGACSRDRGRAEAFCARHGGGQAFISVDEVAQANDIDAVYIASPNALHRGQALACIAGGKHVLVEKPLGSNRREAEEVFEAADAAGVVAMEAMRPLHDPAFRTCQAALPELGRIRRATLRFGKRSSRYDEVLAGRHTNIFDCSMSSGALMDMGIYPVEALVALLGEPESISFAPVLLDESTRGTTNGPIDGAGTILARYPGMTASLHYSKITNDLCESQVEGEEGTLLIDAISTPTRAVLNLREPAPAGGGYTPLAVEPRELELNAAANNMVFEVADFACAVTAMQEGAAPAEAQAGPYGSVAGFQDATLSALKITDEARRQAGIAFPADEGAC